jgi:hypothetical protein
MRMRNDRRMWPVLTLAVLLAAGCKAVGDGAGTGSTATAGGAEGGGMQSTSSAMTVESPSGSCTDAGSSDTVPCMGMASGTTVSFKVVQPAKVDSGSTSTVPYAALMADCTSSGDSGSTSTVPCTVVVKKK